MGRAARSRFGQATLVLALVAVVSTAPRAASAQTPEEEARRLFADASQLMDKKRYAEACPILEAVLEKTPGKLGGMMTLAECYDALGRTATSLAAYRRAAARAKEIKDTRLREIEAMITQLEPRVPVLVITADLARTPGLSVRRDGAAVDLASGRSEIELDPGEHEVLASAPGKKSYEKTVQLAERDRMTVALPALEPLAVAQQRPEAPVVRDEPFPAARGVAIGVGALGLVGIGIGAGFAAAASSSWDDAQAFCTQRDDGLHCNDEGVALADDADTNATISTVGFVGGGIAVGAAVVLWFTAPLFSSDLTEMSETSGVALVPSIGETSGLWVGGAF